MKFENDKESYKMITSETIQEIIEKIKNNRNLYEKSEMNVRRHLIDPILDSLDWNTAKPEQVRHNVKQDGVSDIPDYTLFKNGKKILFIEAKNLSIDIEDIKIIQEIADYSNYESTEFGVVTNGAKWILHKTFEKGKSLPERVVWKVDLENEKLENVLRKLSTISKDNVEQIEKLVKKSQILYGVWTSLLNKPEEIIKGLIPIVKIIIGKDHPDYPFNDAEIEDFLMEQIREITTLKITDKPEISTMIEETKDYDGRKTPRKPKTMRLAGEVISVKIANKILVNTANWLIRKGKLKISDCPIPAGPNNYLVNIEPIHRNGSPFKNREKLSNGLWIFTNFNSDNCEEHSRRLLEKFGYSRDTLVIEWLQQ